MTATEPRVYSIPQLAEIMGHSRDSLYEHIRRQRAAGQPLTVFGIPVIDGPGHLVVSRVKVDALLGTADEEVQRATHAL